MRFRILRIACIGEYNHGHHQAGDFHRAVQRPAEKVAQEHVREGDDHHQEEKDDSDVAAPAQGLFKNGAGVAELLQYRICR